MSMSRCGFFMLAAGYLCAVMPARAETHAPATTALTPEGAREDLELSIAAVEASIPNMYWHQSRIAWDRSKAEARIQVEHVTDSESLWRILRPLLGQIGEGHLGVRLSEAMNQHYRDATRFPLDLLWTEHGAFVLAGYGAAEDIPKGARLVSIDGIDEAELLREMVAVTPHDGVIQTGSMRDISGRGFAAFLYRLRGGQPHYRVVLDGPAGRIERDVPAVARLARPPEAADPSPLPTVEWLDDRTAYLNVPTFSNARFREAGTTFPSAIHAIFVQIQQHRTKDLILDLRQNGGGSEPNESIVFSYLVDKPLRKYAAVEARSRHLSVTSSSGKRFETDVFDDEDKDEQRPIADGRWTRRNTPPHGLMSRWTSFAPVFHGRVVVLIGGSTFSGGAELASMLRHTDRAVFVGEETGGADEGNTSGYRWTVQLPNSGMKIDIPLLQFRMAWAGLLRNRGVLPDCPSPPDPMHADEPHDHAWQLSKDALRQGWHLPREAVCPRG